MSSYVDCNSPISYGRYGSGRARRIHGGNSNPADWDYFTTPTYKSFPFQNQYGGRKKYRRSGRGIITDTLKSAYHHIKRPISKFIRKQAIPFAKGIINGIVGNNKPESYMSIRERMLNGGRRRRRTGRGLPPRYRNWSRTRLGLNYPRGYTRSPITFVGGKKKRSHLRRRR
jgi:hypothetical protein